MTDFLKKYKWKIAGVIVGAIAGYAYYYYIGCNSGTCPIQSHWHTSTLYGAAIGYFLANGPKKEKKSGDKKEQIRSTDK
ncbi:MAG: DUF6132 family protein [Bacteroidota bacterium]